MYPGDSDQFDIGGGRPYITVCDPDGPDERNRMPSNEWNAPSNVKSFRFLETSHGYGKVEAVKDCSQNHQNVQRELLDACFQEFARSSYDDVKAFCELKSQWTTFCQEYTDF